MPEQSLTQEDVAAVQSKLQGLYESLPAEQRPVLETLLAHAADGGAAFQEQGTSAQHSIIIVGGRTDTELAIPLSPGILASLNPQPIPPGEPPDGRRVE
jgi:hypothetical protein